jgi:hypothetical protein
MNKIQNNNNKTRRLGQVKPDNGEPETCFSCGQVIEGGVHLVVKSANGARYEYHVTREECELSDDRLHFEIGENYKRFRGEIIQHIPDLDILDIPIPAGNQKGWSL